jgi:hypothetical protein
MRHTFASVAIAAGIPTFEIARMMGTSVLMIEKTYGHLLADALDRGGARGVRQEHGGARRCTVAMKASSVSIALLLLLIVAVTGYCGTNKRVYVQGKYKPTIVGVGAGREIKDVRWLSYGGERGQAHGLFEVDDCIPNCAQGKVTWEPLRFQVSYVGMCHSRRSYRLLSIPLRGVKDFPLEDC